MSEKTDGSWPLVAADQDDPFADKPFDETAFTVPEEAPAEEPAGNDQMVASLPPSDAPADDDKEAEKRAAHEAAEADRKAEFEARQAQKKQAVQEQIEKVKAMSDDEAMNAAIKRAGADTEKLTRRNMREFVTEHIQTLCVEDTSFARLTLHPRKSMLHCFQYINRKAFEYVQDEMKAQGIKPAPVMQTYGSDIPDDVCYQWAEDYFRDPTVKEDQEEEETFVAKPYPGTSVSKAKAKKPASPKKTDKKPEAKKPAPQKPADDGQLTFGQLSMV